MNLNKKIELLAPAGNIESLIAAVAAGCDAVYLGGTLFSARAFAGNFDHESLLEAIAYCHIRDIKVYIAMNTILYENEMEEAFKEVEFLYTHDIDAIIVQDFGLFHYLRQCFPDLDVHCSTQMHIHNINSIKFMKQQGASRVVLARETPIEIVQQACKLDIEIEVFAYGAICIGYSGQCLMSQATKNRSGNRGKCAQSCRMKYTVATDHTFQKNTDGDYILSPKDLNTIDNLYKLLDAGIHSIKIEGRMKRPEYVFIVVKTFREAIDAYLSNKPYKIDYNRQEQLLLMFNRGFSNGHIFHADIKQRMNHYRPNHQGIVIGEVIQYHRGRVLVKLKKKLYQHDGLRIINHHQDIGINVNRIWKNNLLVNHANVNEQVWIECPDDTIPKKGDILRKTTDHLLIEEIQHIIHERNQKILIKIQCIAKVNLPLKIIVTDNRGNSIQILSNQICQKATKLPTSKEKIYTSLIKTADFPFKIEVCEILSENVFIPISVINETRRHALKKLCKQRSKIHLNRKKPLLYHFTYLAKTLLSETMLVENHHFKMSLPKNIGQISKNRQHFIANNIWQKYPVIHENDDNNSYINHAVLSQIGDLYHDGKNCIAGMNFNITNSYSAVFFASNFKINGIILSSELNLEQIKLLIQAFKDRYGTLPSLYHLTYGRRTLMYIKQGITGYDQSIQAIQDMSGNIFPTEMENGIFNIHENKPMIDKMDLEIGSYLIFTNESEKEANKIINEQYQKYNNMINQSSLLK